MRISDWSSDVCSSDLGRGGGRPGGVHRQEAQRPIRVQRPSGRRCRWPKGRHERAVRAGPWGEGGAGRSDSGRPGRRPRRRRLRPCASPASGGLVAMTLLAALVGALAAAGAHLIYDGLRLRPPVVRTGRSVPEIPRERVLRALGAGLVTALLTRWPVAALGMAAVGWFGAELFGSRRATAQATARTEAIAAWTEMLRDTMSGAHGLEEAVTTSAIVAPAPIRREVTALAVRLERQLLDVALRAFATDRSEEHTSELQSLMRISYAVFCLKKKNNHNNRYISN